MHKPYFVGVPVFVQFNEHGHMIKLSLLPEPKLPTTAKQEVWWTQSYGSRIASLLMMENSAQDISDWAREGVSRITSWIFRPTIDILAQALLYIIASQPAAFEKMIELIFTRWIEFPNYDDPTVSND